jgi:cell division protein FtsB
MIRLGIHKANQLWHDSKKREDTHIEDAMAYKKTRKMGLGTALFFAVVIALTGYFMFAAIQGDYGHLRRIQVEAEERRLIDQLHGLKTERAEIENKAHRLSDEYLDLDLLDERVRKVLGMARVDDVIIR